MLALVLGRSWVASLLGHLGWDLLAGHSPHQHQAAAAERKNQWEALMLKNSNKRKSKLKFKAARHLWELFFQKTKTQLFPATKGLEENKL